MDIDLKLDVMLTVTNYTPYVLDFGKGLIVKEDCAIAIVPNENVVFTFTVSEEVITVKFSLLKKGVNVTHTNSGAVFLLILLNNTLTVIRASTGDRIALTNKSNTNLTVVRRTNKYPYTDFIVVPPKSFAFVQSVYYICDSLGKVIAFHNSKKLGVPKPLLQITSTRAFDGTTVELTVEEY